MHTCVPLDQLKTLPGSQWSRSLTWNSHLSGFIDWCFFWTGAAFAIFIFLCTVDHANAVEIYICREKDPSPVKNPLGVNCACKLGATQITFDWLIDWLTRCDRRSSTTIHTVLGRLQNIWRARQLCGSVWNNWSPPVPAKGIKWRAPPVFLRETCRFLKFSYLFLQQPDRTHQHLGFAVSGNRSNRHLLLRGKASAVGTGMFWLQLWMAVTGTWEQGKGPQSADPLAACSGARFNSITACK